MMTDRDNWNRPFWKGAFSESDGTGSTSRILSTIIVVAALTWVTIVVLHTKAIPELGSVAAFVSSAVGVLYGVNKISTKTSDTIIQKTNILQQK